MGSDDVWQWTTSLFILTQFHNMLSKGPSLLRGRKRCKIELNFQVDWNANPKRVEKCWWKFISGRAVVDVLSHSLASPSQSTNRNWHFLLHHTNYDVTVFTLARCAFTDVDVPWCDVSMEIFHRASAEFAAQMFSLHYPVKHKSALVVYTARRMLWRENSKSK